MQTKQSQKRIRAILLGSIGFLGLAALLPAMGGGSIPSSDLTVTVQELASGDVQLSVSGTAYSKTDYSIYRTEYDYSQKTPPHTLTSNYSYKVVPAGLTLTVNAGTNSEAEEGGNVEQTISEEILELPYVNFSSGGYWHLLSPLNVPTSIGNPIVGGGMVVSSDIPFSSFVPGTFAVSGDYFDLTYQVLPYVAPLPGPPSAPVASNPALSIQAPRRFRPTSVGRTSRAQRIRVRNVGDAPVSGILVSLAGRSAQDFEVSQAVPKRLPPGRSASFRATFRPTKSGVRRALVVIRSSAPTRAAALSGEATAKVPASPILPFR